MYCFLVKLERFGYPIPTLDMRLQVVAGFDVSDRRKLKPFGVECADTEDQGLLDIGTLAKELGDAVPALGLRKLCYHFGYPIRAAARVHRESSDKERSSVTHMIMTT